MSAQLSFGIEHKLPQEYKLIGSDDRLLSTQKKPLTVGKFNNLVEGLQADPDISPTEVNDALSKVLPIRIHSDKNFDYLT